MLLLVWLWSPYLLPWNCYYFSAYFVCGVSILNVLLTNVDRFLAIHYPLRYDTIVTVPRVFSLIISCWLISALSTTLWVWHKTAFEYVVNAFMIAFVSTSTVIQIMIYRVVRRHRREIHAQEEVVRITHHFNMMLFIKSCINTILVHALSLNILLLALSRNWDCVFCFKAEY